MKVKGLDGKEYSWKLAGRSALESDTGGRSSGHLRARALLAQLFPAELRLEEVGLPGTGGLRADFVLPSRRLVIEVHGQQHYEFSGHFHETQLGFLQGQHRDRKKARWCELNGLVLVELPADESDDDWTERILNS